MNCPHLERTVAWAHGEADDAHLAHLATCQDCRRAVAGIEAVWAAVSPVAPQLAAPPPRVNRTAWLSVALALAAAALLFLRATAPTPLPELPEDRVDAELSELEAAVDALSSDLSDL